MCPPFEKQFRLSSFQKNIEIASSYLGVILMSIYHTKMNQKWRKSSFHFHFIYFPFFYHKLEVEQSECLLCSVVLCTLPLKIKFTILRHGQWTQIYKIKLLCRFLEIHLEFLSLILICLSTLLHWYTLLSISRVCFVSGLC